MAQRRSRSVPGEPTGSLERGVARTPPCDVAEFHLAGGLLLQQSMRKTLIALILCVATPAVADQGGDFGLGLQIGGPSGLSGKYYMDRFALQFGVGVIEQGWDDGTQLHVDALWHPVVLTRQSAFDMPFYVGVGARVLSDDNDEWDYCDRFGCYDVDDDLSVGVRIPVGILMAFRSVPLDAFFELAPTIDLIHDDDALYCERNGVCYYDDDDRFALYGSIGGRYYF